MTDEKIITRRLLAVVRDVYDGGRLIIGERWGLLRKMKEMADRSDATGMIRYFEECLQSDRGKRVAGKLKAAEKKSLESEEPHVWAIVVEALVEAKVDCVCGVTDVSTRKRLEESFEAYWKRDSLGGAIALALRQRLQGKRGILSAASLRSRLNVLPFVFIRREGPGFDRVRHLLEQAGEAYLFGLFESSAVMSRAALEVAVVERWVATRKEPVPKEQLIGTALQAGVVAQAQRKLVLTVKKVGDDAAHGGGVDGSRAREALAALRRFIGEFQWQ